MNRTGSGAYTYSQSLQDFKKYFSFVIGGDVTDYAGYGWHGIRVAGYNASILSANGESLTVAHGGWKSTAHERYRRFTMKEVLQIPANMVGSSILPVPGVRSICGKTVVRGRATHDSSSDDDGECADGEASGSDFDDMLATYESSMLPPAYSRVERNRDGLARSYVVYVAPDGHACDSRPAAWAYFRRPAEGSESTSSSPGPSPGNLSDSNFNARPRRRAEPMAARRLPSCREGKSLAIAMVDP